MGFRKINTVECGILLQSCHAPRGTMSHVNGHLRTEIYKAALEPSPSPAPYQSKGIVEMGTGLTLDTLTPAHPYRYIVCYGAR